MLSDGIFPPQIIGFVALPLRLLFSGRSGSVPFLIEGVTDPDGDPVLVTVVDIFQDEKLVNDGSGETCPDGDVLALRASSRD